MSDETNDQFRCIWERKTKANGNNNENYYKNFKQKF